MDRREFLAITSAALAAPSMFGTEREADAVLVAQGQGGQVKNAQNLYAESGKMNAMSRFSGLAHELSNHEGVVVGVMSDPRFAGKEVPQALRYEHIAEVWGAIPGVRVVPLDADQIRSYAILFKGKMDLLVFPYGGVYPMEAFGLYSGQSFNYFLRRGGAVLTTGGIPFSGQASPFGEVMDTSSPEKLTEVFDKWISKFGIKYYQCRVAPTKEECDADLLPGIDAAAWTPSSTGVVIINSSHEPVPKPPAGNVFPERTPARTVLPLLHGTDKWGQELCISAELAQDFENGSRRIHFTHEATSHPLTPDMPHFKPLMKALFSLLMNKVFIKDVETEYACYRQGEGVTIRMELASFESGRTTVTVLLEIVDAAGKVVHRTEKRLTLPPGRVQQRVETWRPEGFESDEYTIRVLLRRDGHTVSKAANGFVVWNENVVSQGPRIGIQGHYFTIQGQTVFLTGTNYYESTRGEGMWFRPNTAQIIRDHRRMHECGVNMIRPHYHHLKWFRDYLLYHHEKLPDFYSELEEGVGPMPDERVWRIWDMFIYLGQKYGIVYNGDLFTLVPEEMGDPRGWFGTVEAVYDEARREQQKEFLLAIDRRYRSIPGITWDLFNEPYMVEPESIGKWAEDLNAALKADDSQRLITVGGPAHITSGVDYDCPHGALAPTFRNTSSRPVLLQELHFDKPEPLESELLQVEGFRNSALTALYVGGAGWMPWSWTRQRRLWQDTYEHHHTFPMEKWDDRLGMHTHEDGTLKPAGLAFRDLAFLLSGIHPLSHDPDTHQITTTGGILSTRLANGDTGHEILYMKGEHCLAGLARNTVALNGKTLLEGPAGSYLSMRALAGGFDEALELFVKSELPGDILVHRSGVDTVELVDASPTDCRVLETVEFTNTSEAAKITVTGEMNYYWLRVRFKGEA